MKFIFNDHFTSMVNSLKNELIDGSIGARQYLEENGGWISGALPTSTLFNAAVSNRITESNQTTCIEEPSIARNRPNEVNRIQATNVVYYDARRSSSAHLNGSTIAAANSNGISQPLASGYLMDSNNGGRPMLSYDEDRNKNADGGSDDNSERKKNNADRSCYLSP